MMWIERNKERLIRNSFLLPILLVVIMSISHVISWYDLGNPLSWAIYLSIAIEIFALASVSAASINVGRGAIWLLFGLVTLIQIIGNVFFEYIDIDPNSEIFKNWVELISFAFNDWTIIDHRRFLAIIQGGTLPVMSLTALHFYIKFNDIKLNKNKELDPKEDYIIPEDQVKEEKPKRKERTIKNDSFDFEELINIEKDNSPILETPINIEDIKIEEGENLSDDEIIAEILNSSDIDSNELSEAKKLWMKDNPSLKNVSAKDLIEFYRQYKRSKEIDPKTGKLKKIDDDR